MKTQQSILDLIEKKKRAKALTRAEIDRFVDGIVHGTVPDYQLAALLMAIYFQGMDAEETHQLTMRMAESGHMADLSVIDGVCVDKHSTGGVADTTTLILVPLVAACGGKVAKMSGRGLGHTGGTVDKLESIPGMQTEIPMEQFIQQVQRIGCAVIGQSADLAPADKVLYGMRDVTGTVDSLPLIVSSIMSKKIAAGSGAIVLDVKTGSGALMHTLEESIALAQSMVDVGALAQKPTLAVVTGMDQPLGTHIGNALEVKEAIDVLSGKTESRLLDVSLRLGKLMLLAGGYAPDDLTARRMLIDALRTGKGLAKLREMIEAQGGDGRVCEDTSLLPQAPQVIPVYALRGGHVVSMDTTRLGEASQQLGAGRATKDDVIDPAVGIVMDVELGNRVAKGAPLVTIHAGADSAHTQARVERARAMVLEAIEITDEPASLPPLIYATVTPDGVERMA